MYRHVYFSTTARLTDVPELRTSISNAPGAQEHKILLLLSEAN